MQVVLRDRLWFVAQVLLVSQGGKELRIEKIRVRFLLRSEEYTFVQIGKATIDLPAMENSVAPLAKRKQAPPVMLARGTLLEVVYLHAAPAVRLRPPAHGAGSEELGKLAQNSASDISSHSGIVSLHSARMSRHTSRRAAWL